MATTEMVAIADLSPLDWFRSNVFFDWYDHIDDIPTKDGRYLTAAQSGWSCWFRLGYVSGDPGDIDTVTGIEMLLRYLFTSKLGASTFGIAYNLRKSDGTPLAGKTNWLSNRYSPYDVTLIFNPVSIPYADLNNAILEIKSNGTGWGFFQAVVQLSNVAPITLTYTPVVTFERVEEFDSFADKDHAFDCPASKVHALEAPASKIVTLSCSASKVLTLYSPGDKDYDYRC